MYSELVDSIAELPGEHVVFWVVTHNTKDYGDRYVLRRQAPGKGVLYVEREPVLVSDHLTEIRAEVPLGLQLLPRSDQDDPVIVESWF